MNDRIIFFKKTHKETKQQNKTKQNKNKTKNKRFQIQSLKTKRTNQSAITTY